MGVYVMGIGGSVHDFSCCIVQDGIVMVAIEEERLSREKHGIGKRSLIMQCIDYCLNAVGCTLNDIDLIVSNDLFRFSPGHVFPYMNNIVRINHHMAHAAGTYYTSGFDHSAILICDGCGSSYWDNSEETMSFGFAQNGSINVFEKLTNKSIYIPDYLHLGYNEWRINPKSPSSLYTFITYLLGFKILEEGKTMGLSPYGTDKYVNTFYKYIDVNSPYDYTYHLDSKELFEFIADVLADKNEDSLFQAKADLAYAVQDIMEKQIFAALNHLYEKTQCSSLCLGGGAALNSVLNGKIMDNTPFGRVFVHPAACDSGTSIGAALYGYYSILKNSYSCGKSIMNAYTGRVYEPKEIKRVLDGKQDVLFYKEWNENILLQKAADMIAKGKIIGWFQGGSEIGPRALGNRSILVDPRRSEMKDILNSRVKFRECFRPFAPVVMAEYAQEYFDMRCEEIPYMLFIMNVHEEKRRVIPAVTHIDGSARLQTVSMKNNQRLYKLLENFNKITGVPVLLNTSFNIKGRPIVENPSDAINTFIEADMDCLIIDDFIVYKKEVGKNT